MITLTDVFQLKTATLLHSILPKALRKYGYRGQLRKELYLYGAGIIPVLLVAHADTIHPKPPNLILRESKGNILWSPQGLGADDRAGVWAILRLLEENLRPHVLFTTGEECGARGAIAAGRELRPKVNLVLGLDRQGRDDACTYECENPKTSEYLAGFGFHKTEGTFSDISFVCPDWGVSGANLSIGYYYQHTRKEYLCLDELRSTIVRVGQILQDPPAEVFAYQERDWRAFYGLGDDDWEDTCPVCEQEVLTLWQLPGMPEGLAVCATCFTRITGEPAYYQSRSR